ncbi:MAG TPA: hypothetical protein VKV38_04705 [Trebonia sp.]|nr:hypothetical protein [Trebonia sp.]
MDVARIVRFWQAAETFNPRPLPQPDVREHVADVRPGEPMPWEPGSRLAARPPAPGKQWRHQVFGGIFQLCRVREALVALYGDDDPGHGDPGHGDPGHGPARGESALFACTVGADGTLAAEPAYSGCAWALGRAAAGGGDPGAWLSRSATTAPLLNPPDGPLTGADLRRYAAELAGLFGVATLLQPGDHLRVRSFQVPAGESADGLSGDPLGARFAADLSLVADALRGTGGAPGPALAAFAGGGTGRVGRADTGRVGRVDVRRRPLLVRDGCTPDRIPLGRWVSDRPLVLSEQFAVNEIMAGPGESGGLFAVHTPPGTSAAAVFSDLVAAVVVDRARRLADLPDTRAAFGGSHAWRGHTVRAPAAALTGSEIVLAWPDEVPGAGLAGAGARWRDRARQADYFASTAQLACGDGAWALLAAPLGDRAGVRGFTERFWHGTLHGAEALFSAGESMPAALRRLREAAVGWPAAVGSFRAALAKVSALSSERAVAAAALTRLSRLEHDLKEAASALEAKRNRCAELAGREPAVAAAVAAAGERRRAALAALAALAARRPRPGSGLRLGPSAALRASREWYASRAALRVGAAEAERQHEAALGNAAALRASLTAARRAVAEASDDVDRLTAEMAPLEATVARARLRWGDHLPGGTSYDETEDAALTERRELSVPWGDEEYAAARAELFLAALTLHKALIAAEAETFEANFRALLDLLSAEGTPPAPAALAAWQSFFLVVPVVQATFGGIGTLFAGLGRGSLGWLLAEHAGHAPPQHLAGALWRADRAVLAGDSLRAAPAGTLPWAGQRAVARALGVGAEWEPGRVSAQRAADRAARYGTWLPWPLSGPPSGSPSGSPSGPPEGCAPAGTGWLWVGMPLHARESADGEALAGSDAWVQRVLQRQGVPRPKRRSA